MIDTAYVNIWGQRVGAVAWDDSSGTGSFEYDRRFIGKGYELAPFRMPLRLAPGVFSFPELRSAAPPAPDTFRGLPGLLADSLPDRYANQLIDLWLTRKGRVPGSMNPVETLCFIGTRGMGALEFEPASPADTAAPASLEITELVELARKILSQRKAFHTSLKKNQEKTIRDLLKVGTSAGGARPKAVIAYNEKTGEVRSGQSYAPAGFTHWLIKLDGVSDVQVGETTGYGRVEMAYHLMAAACGIQMMPCRLLEENGRAHFMTMRFDRESNAIKHHIQTFCAIQHFDYNNVTGFSYEQLFQTMRTLRLGYPEAEQMFRRMVFNVLARNCDDHTKNFAFRLKQLGSWELAPAYDVCHAYRPESVWVSQHALSINGKRTAIEKTDLLEVAASAGIKKPVPIVDEVNAAVADWKKYADLCGVDPELRKTISKTHLRLN